MRSLSLALIVLWLGAVPAASQQNQTPGDTTAGGNNTDSKPSTAQAGANTTDGTTTGSSGPQKKESGPPGDRALPPLPSAELCASYKGEVRAACLSTVMYQRPNGSPGDTE